MTEQYTKGKVILIKGISQYNVLDYACELMAKGFEANGYRSVVLDGREINLLIEAIDILKQEMEDNGLFIFSFNPLFGETLVNDNLGMYDYLGFPVFAFLVDHPYFHTTRLNYNQGSNYYLSCVDYNHITYMKKYHPNIQNVMFLPHFGFRAAEYIPYPDREIDVYFPGSYQSLSERERTLDEMPDIFKYIAIKLRDDMLKDKNLVLEDALENYLASIQFEYNSEDFTDLMDAMVIVDQYVRDYHRDSIISTILESGITLTVAGVGWRALQEKYPGSLRIVSEDGLDIEDNIRMIANSKILLNILPSFKNGSHERVFTAMMNGCVCLSNENQFFAEHFDDHKEIVYYDMDHLEQLPDKIHQLLEDPEQAMRIAESGREKVKDEYDFKELSRKILTIMGCE